MSTSVAWGYRQRWTGVLLTPAWETSDSGKSAHTTNEEGVARTLPAALDPEMPRTNSAVANQSS